MAIVATAYVRVKMLSDALGKDISNSVKSALDDAGVDKVGETIGNRLADGINDGIDKNLKPTINRLERIQANVDLDATAAREELHNLTDAQEVELDVDLDKDFASPKLAWLTRTRKILLLPIIDSKALAAAEAALTRLSGGRALKELGDMLLRLGKNMDLIAPKFGALLTGVFGLAGAATALVSNLSGVAYSIGAIAPLALTLPGIFVSAGIGIGVLVAALKDTKTELADLGKSFTRLQEIISNNFWKVAETPIRTMVKTLMPSLRRELGATATQFGVMASTIASTIASSRGMAAVNTMLHDTTLAIASGTKGAASWTYAFLELGTVGTHYLKQLVVWLNEVGAKFEGWVSKSIDSGQMFAWVDNAIVQFKALGSVFASLGSILASVGRAAQEAGGASLESFAAGLRGVADAMKSVQGQQSMAMLFSSGHAAMAAMTPGLEAFGRSLRDDIIPLLGTAMPEAGRGTGAMFETLAGVFSSPAFGPGIVDWLSGTADGLESLQGASGPLGDMLGNIASAFGEVARGILNVIASGIKELGPTIGDIAAAAAAVVPALSGGLVGILEKIGPKVREASAAFREFAEANPMLAAGLTAAAGGIAIVVRAATSMIGPIIQIAEVLGPTLEPILTKIPNLFSGILGPAAAVIGLLVGMYMASEPFRESVNKLGGVLMELLAPAFMAFQQVLAAAGPMVWAALGFLGQLASILINALIPAVQSLIPAVTVAFAVVGTIISGAFQLITGILNGFTQMLQGDFSGGLSTIGDAFSSVFGPLVKIVGDGLTGIGEAITGWLAGVGQWFTDGWNGVTQTAGGWFTGVGQSVTDGLTGIGESITGWLAGVGQWFTDGWKGLTSIVSDALAAVGAAVQTWWDGEVQFFGPAIEGLGSIFGNIITILSAPFTAAFEAIQAVVAAAFLIIVGLFTGNGQLIYDTVNAFSTTINNIFSGMFATIFGAVTGIKDTLVGAALLVWTTIQNMWTSIVTTVSTGVSQIIGFVSSLPATIGGFFVAMGQTIMTTATNAWNSAKAAFNTGVAAVVLFVTTLPGKVVSALSSLGSSLMSVATSAWNSVRTAFSTGIATVVAVAATITSQVVSTIQSMPGQVAAIGTNVVTALANAIREGITGVINAAQEMVNSAIKAAKSVLGIKSPSKVFESIGENTGQGLVNGLLGMAGAVGRAGESLVARLPDSVSIPLSIPMLAAGGVVGASTSGTLALLGEAGRSERVEPLDSSGLSERDRALIHELAGSSGDQFILQEGAITVSAADLMEFQSLVDYLDGLRVTMRKR
ncbi:MAG: phage tail protein [Candidatus Nanopelagicales bacterium]